MGPGNLHFWQALRQCWPGLSTNLTLSTKDLMRLWKGLLIAVKLDRFSKTQSDCILPLLFAIRVKFNLPAWQFKTGHPSISPVQLPLHSAPPRTEREPSTPSHFFHCFTLHLLCLSSSHLLNSSSPLTPPSPKPPQAGSCFPQLSLNTSNIAHRTSHMVFYLMCKSPTKLNPPSGSYIFFLL